MAYDPHVHTKPSYFSQFVHKYGTNTDIDTATVPEDIWPAGVASTPTTLVWQDSVSTASVVSSNAADAAAGTGTQTLFIDGVDDNFNSISETITMNGLTPVISSNSYLHINRMFALVSGTNDTNVGDITATLGSDINAVIPANVGQTQQAIYQIPTADSPNSHAHLTHLWITVGKPQSSFAVMKLFVWPDGGSMRAFNDVAVDSSAIFDHVRITPHRFVPGTRVWWQCTEASANNMQVYTGFEIAWWT